MVVLFGLPRVLAHKDCRPTTRAHAKSNRIRFHALACRHWLSTFVSIRGLEQFRRTFTTQTLAWKRLPSASEALEWQSLHKEWVTWLRDTDGAHSQQKIDTRARELSLRELEWSSPPHLTPWKTPVPAEYFQRVAGGSNTWCLLRQNSR